MKCPFTAAQHHKKWGFARLCSGAALAIVCASAMLGSRVDAQETVVPSSQPLAVKRLQPSTTPQGPAEPKTLKPSPVNDPLGICRTDGSVTPEQRALQLGLFLCGRHFLFRELESPEHLTEVDATAPWLSGYSTGLSRKGLKIGFVHNQRWKQDFDHKWDRNKAFIDLLGASDGIIEDVRAVPETSCLHGVKRNDFRRLFNSKKHPSNITTDARRMYAKLGRLAEHLELLEPILLPGTESDSAGLLEIDFGDINVRKINFECRAR
jgi:hypothetical protein